MPGVSGVEIIMFSFKLKTAYEMRISDWSSAVCSSDPSGVPNSPSTRLGRRLPAFVDVVFKMPLRPAWQRHRHGGSWRASCPVPRSEEHTSELQSLMRISYAVFCLKKKNIHRPHTAHNTSRHVTTTNQRNILPILRH